jgi:hypothetical protein
LGSQSQATAEEGEHDAAPKRESHRPFSWQVEKGARSNYCRLGRRLAGANKNLFRNGGRGHGVILVASDGTWRLITKASQLAPIIVDCLTMKVMKEGKVVSELPSAAHLNAMLRSEVFLQQFPPVDRVTRAPLYDEDFSLLHPGYHDGGERRRLLYLGPKPQVTDSLDTIRRFLDVMDFATAADRTNAVGAALTVLLRHRWPGEKPLVLITGTKSHAGKGTTAEFVRGSVAKADVLFEAIDWPMQSQFQRQVAQDPEIGVVFLDNVRLDSAGGRARFVRSAWLESFVTMPEVMLASPGAGEAIRLENRFVFIVNTNDGMLSPDLLNRAVPIHLAPRGNVHDRPCPIGNPKLEFLPQNRDRIEAELRGMIEYWRKKGQPLDEGVRHPMSLWAKTVGGILQVNGFTGFLANYHLSRVTEDPTREALAILAGAAPGKAMKPTEWAKIAVDQGLARTLFVSHDRDTENGRARAIGKTFTKHLGEVFTATTDHKQLRVRLDGGYVRWETGANPDQRYVFTILEQSDRPVDRDDSLDHPGK